LLIDALLQSYDDWQSSHDLETQRVYAGKPTDFIIVFADTVVGVIAFFVFFLSDEFGAVKVYL